ncbi:hypothetical protein BBJ41_01195 [Burkholderia stabilis]|nr:hypothetical protein BBJ41_01195 [Burkholderia stabilis]
MYAGGFRFAWIAAPYALSQVAQDQHSGRRVYTTGPVQTGQWGLKRMTDLLVVGAVRRDGMGQT